ncbi:MULTISPECIES: DUF3311 domain-containing protein [Streptomyces]|uniref:DUF3311 domain-containing protein n=1 Tax=Streptomyces TaxID=1883 RepID=UPI000C26F51B|nr:DUF3311 domain-containing protein [Streptomyces sp. CB01201]MBX7471555.1 DUF3311 domain-containing protein [Streptomyces sp. MAG02]PJM99280.1 hypothetical protein CG740_30600 [Streptomyces sp. CB01201]
MRRRRTHLLWLGVPYLLYLGALPFVNKVRPVVLGLPFLFFWLLLATVVTPLAIWLTWRGDHKGARQRRAR